VEIVEYAITVRSTHAAPHLVILSEYLPHVGEEGIKVELLKPAKEEILQVIFTLLLIFPMRMCIVIESKCLTRVSSFFVTILLRLCLYVGSR